LKIAISEAKTQAGSNQVHSEPNKTKIVPVVKESMNQTKFKVSGCDTAAQTDPKPIGSEISVQVELSRDNQEIATQTSVNETKLLIKIEDTRYQVSESASLNILSALMGSTAGISYFMPVAERERFLALLAQNARVLSSEKEQTKLREELAVPEESH